MGTLNLTLSAPSSVNRDAKVELIHQLSGARTEITPYLDGTASARGLADGAYTMRVTHPNYTFPLVTQDIRVFPDRPTIIPIVIPADLLTFTAVEDRPDANLGPVQAQLDAAAQVATRQAAKRGGEPIYAADWNELADAVNDVAGATSQLTRLVAPDGHNHPEIERKLAEVDANLQRFFDVFGRTIVELQRQVQQLAVQRHMDDALNAAGVSPTDPIRAAVKTQVDRLADASHDPPAVYTRKAQEAGRSIEATLSTVSAADDAPEGTAELITKAVGTATALTSLRTVLSYREEAEGMSRVGRSAALNLRTATKA